MSEVTGQLAIFPLFKNHGGYRQGAGRKKSGKNKQGLVKSATFNLKRRHISLLRECALVAGTSVSAQLRQLLENCLDGHYESVKNNE